jgi:hypothetical protein
MGERKKTVIVEPGDRYGRLLVLAEGVKKGNVQHYICACDCGGFIQPRKYALKNGTTKSCGCLAQENRSHIGKSHATHLASNTPLYYTWIDMRRRCTKSSHHAFNYYGGRGISVCPEWANDFAQFAKDMGEKPSPEYSLDRIDVNGDYTPKNCRWATAEQQSNNLRSNTRIIWCGQDLTVTQWARKVGCHDTTLFQRIRSGWCPTKILLTPIRKQKTA